MSRLSRVLPLVLALVLVFGPAGPLFAAEEPETETVAPRDLTLSLELEGTLIPRDAVGVAYEGEVYGGKLEIVEGTASRRVRKGEVLVRFEEEEALRQAGNAERDLKSARIKFERLQADTRHKQRARALKLAQLEYRARRADETLARYLEIDKPLRVAQAEHGLEGSENRLQEQVEELEQLEKMYRADDLTEETEEIVLKRARRALRRMQKSLEFSRIRHRELLEVRLPQDEQSHRFTAEERRAELDAYRVTSEHDAKLAAIALEKAEVDLRRQKSRFDDLRRDIDGLRLRAPRDGVAVPGRFADGKWQDVEGILRLVEEQGSAKSGQTLYTVVTPGNVAVRATVGEADLLKLRNGLAAEVRPGVMSDRALPAVIDEVFAVGTKGRFPVTLSLKETESVLMPGESAKVKVAWSVLENALTVPEKAIRTKDGKSHVWVWVDGKSQAREVERGAKSEGRVQVERGLEAGDRVLVVAPEDSS